MCGIAGIFGIDGSHVDQREVQAMCQALVQRGPDDEGYYTVANIGLGMRRLSIIDLATGQQPVANEDDTIQVVLNGEIYNFRELRKELEAKGHRFSTVSDTEVIVHLYEEYGVGCVDKLRGMFAFALWDANLKRLLLVRDRLGIKPLFYGVFDGKFVFASELKALLQLSWVERNLDFSAVSHLFTFLTTPSDQSIIAGVHKLEPGHLLTIELNKAPTIREYWDVDFATESNIAEGPAIERLRELLQESVKLRMISDVPIGAFLSGGIDSSAIVGTMAGMSDRPVKTFTIGFPEKQFNEVEHARLMANHFGTEHHELILEPDVIGMISDLAWHLDEPFGDSSAIPTYMVSKLAAEHVKVVLSGDGGDELFAGYDKYRVERGERRYRHIPALIRSLFGAVGKHMAEGMKGRNFMRHLALNGSHRYLDAATLFDREEKQSLFSGAVVDRVMRADPWKELATCLGRVDTHWLSAIQYLDIKHYLPLDILTKVDRMSMANSLEARVPLLDHKLVEFTATIAPNLKLQGSTTKHVFKQAMRGILPDAIIDRPKQGFAVPLGRWFRGELNGFVHDLLLSPTSQARNIFNSGYIEKLLAMQARGRDLDLQLWTMISFELWCQTFLDKKVARTHSGFQPHLVAAPVFAETSNSARRQQQ